MGSICTALFQAQLDNGLREEVGGVERGGRGLRHHGLGGETGKRKEGKNIKS